MDYLARVVKLFLLGNMVNKESISKASDPANKSHPIIWVNNYNLVPQLLDFVSLIVQENLRNQPGFEP